MKTALITGATSGIGMEMAVSLHNRGWELVLSGRNEKMLRKMAKKFGRNTKYLALDLSERGSAEKLYQFCKGTRIDFLINNAGFGVFGEFTETDLDAELQLIDVNIRAVHILTKLFLKDFVRRNSGIILNVASSAGFLSGPLLSSYYASKNYVVRLSTAIREELRRKGSDVQIGVLCPGPVDTNFNNRAGVTFSAKPVSAKYVAEYAVKGSFAGKGIMIPTLGMKLGVIASKFVPEEIAVRFVYELQKRKESV
ncbi:MAG: SDR family NAD(P)-dependent oxidoreductase [Ruminococcus sp.]|nr:SDR family NAD(P)-dependent oxidoreductase [Ruminococcus sp.]